MYEKFKILIGSSHVKVENLLHNYTTDNLKTHTTVWLVSTKSVILLAWTISLFHDVKAMDKSSRK